MGWERVVAASVAAGGPIDVRTAVAESGLAARTILRRAAREGWLRPFPEVIAVPGTRVDGRYLARAAVLHCTGRTGDADRDRAALTRGSALALLGLQRSFPSRTEVAVRADRRIGPRPSLRVVRTRSLSLRDIRIRDGVPLLVGATLLRELAPVRDRRALRSIAIDLAHAGHLQLATLPDYLCAHPRFAGRPALRAATAELLGAGRTDSPFEFELRQRLLSEAIALDHGQVPIPGRVGMHLDLGIAAIRFGIEADSFAHHASRGDLERDAARANVVAALDADWRVLHATWSTLDRGWDAFVGLVREVIGLQARRHLGKPWPEPEDLSVGGRGCRCGDGLGCCG